MTNMIIKLFLFSTIAASVLGKNSDNTRSGGGKDELLDKYHAAVTDLESSLPDCGVGGVRQYLRTGAFTHCEPLRDLSDTAEQLLTNNSTAQGLYSSECRNQKQCFEHLTAEVESVKEMFNNLTAISTECKESTTLVDIAISSTYNATGRMQELLADANGIVDSPNEAERPEIVLVNFTAEHATTYSTACTENGGNYTEVSYLALCDEIDGPRDEIVKSLLMVVFDHPRCYSDSCQEEDRRGLLQEFAMRPTEELNQQGDLFWLCIGSEAPPEDLVFLIFLLTYDSTDDDDTAPSESPSYHPTSTPNLGTNSPTASPKNSRPPTSAATRPPRVPTKKNNSTATNTESDTMFDQAMDIYEENQIIVVGLGAAILVALIVCCCCLYRLAGSGGDGGNNDVKRPLADDSDDDSDDESDDENEQA